MQVTAESLRPDAVLSGFIAGGDAGQAAAFRPGGHNLSDAVEHGAGVLVDRSETGLDQAVVDCGLHLPGAGGIAGTVQGAQDRGHIARGGVGQAIQDKAQ